MLVDDSVLPWERSSGTNGVDPQRYIVIFCTAMAKKDSRFLITAKGLPFTLIGTLSVVGRYVQKAASDNGKSLGTARLRALTVCVLRVCIRLITPRFRFGEDKEV